MFVIYTPILFIERSKKNVFKKFNRQTLNLEDYQRRFNLNQKAPLTSKFDGCQITRNVWQKVTFKMLPYLDQVFRFWEGSLLICGILAFAVASTLSAILPVYTIELLPNSNRPIFHGIFFAINRFGAHLLVYV